MPTPSESPDNVLINKAAIIERSLKRMREEYRADPDLRNYTHIDAERYHALIDFCRAIGVRVEFSDERTGRD
jgi:hypothetical protein